MSKDEVLMFKYFAIQDENKHKMDQRFDAQTVVQLAESHEELRKQLEVEIDKRKAPGPTS